MQILNPRLIISLKSILSQTWTYLYRYFPGIGNVIDIREPSTINKPENAITMFTILHDDFGAFYLALEAIPVSILKYNFLSS